MPRNKTRLTWTETMVSAFGSFQLKNVFDMSAEEIEAGTTLLHQPTNGLKHTQVKSRTNMNELQGSTETKSESMS